MQNSNVSSSSINPYKAYSSTESSTGAYKAYGSGMSPEDASWWQQATMALMNHYSDLKKGVNPEQSQHIFRPQDLQQLLQWMQGFAAQRGIPFDPMMAANSGPMGPIGPNGIPMGTQGNAVFKDPTKNTIEIDGSVSQIDVWGNNNIINFPPPWQVTSEVGTAGIPPTKAIKIIGTDNSQKGPDGQPLKVVVFIHEPDGTQNTVNAWKKANGQINFQDNTGGLVKAGEYKAPQGQSGGASAGGIKGGTTEKLADNKFKVNGKSGEVITINPPTTPPSDPKNLETYEVFGEVNLVLQMDQQADVTSGSPDGWVITIKDSQGNPVQKIHARSIGQDGAKVQLNMNTQFLFVHGGKTPYKLEKDKDGKYPFISDDFNINGTACVKLKSQWDDKLAAPRQSYLSALGI